MRTALIRTFINGFAKKVLAGPYGSYDKVGIMTHHLESLFLIQQRNHSVCSLCNNYIIKNTSIFVLYITVQNLGHSLFENMFLRLYFQAAEHFSVSVLQYFVTHPKVLLIELLSNCINQKYFPETVDKMQIIDNHMACATEKRVES